MTIMTSRLTSIVWFIIVIIIIILLFGQWMFFVCLFLSMCIRTARTARTARTDSLNLKEQRERERGTDGYRNCETGLFYVMQFICKYV